MCCDVFKPCVLICRYLLILGLLSIASVVSGEDTYPDVRHIVSNDERKALSSLLMEQGFSGIVDDSVEYEYFGQICTHKERYKIYTYQRNFGNLRVTSRLLVFNSTMKYLGMYDISEMPSEINGRRIIFPVSADHGSEILFDENGPPEQVLLDGYAVRLFK